MYRALRALLLCAILAVAAEVSAEAQSWRTLTSARQLQDRQPVDVEIQYGAGTLRIQPTDEAVIYRMELRYDENTSSPVAEFDRQRRVLRLGARSPEMSRRGLNAMEGSSATIRLSREVPLDLDLEFGVGKADIELGGIPLQRLELSTGASEAVVSFGRPNPIRAERVAIESGAADLRVMGLGNARAAQVDFKGGVGETVIDFSGADGNMSASIEMGVGSVTLRMPRGHGVRIDRSSFLASFDAPGMTRNGNSYLSSNWNSATQKITVDVKAAVGSIEVEWID